MPSAMSAVAVTSSWRVGLLLEGAVRSSRGCGSRATSSWRSPWWVRRRGGWRARRRWRPSSAAGTTRLAMPQRSQSAADRSSPRNISSLARCGPTIRGQQVAPPASGMIPRFTNTSMRRAVSAITTRSHASTRLAPPPAAVPFTAATTGFSQSRIDATSRCQPRRIIRDTSPRARSGASSGRGGSGGWRATEPGARAEVLLAGAREHHRPHAEGGRQLVEGGGEVVAHRGGERVAGVGAVDRDRGRSRRRPRCGSARSPAASSAMGRHRTHQRVEDDPVGDGDVERAGRAGHRDRDGDVGEVAAAPRASPVRSVPSRRSAGRSSAAPGRSSTSPSSSVA